MSAFLRSGSSTAALQYYEKLKESIADGKIKAMNTIACTAALRSAALAYDLDKVMQIFIDMRQKYKCTPNVRTYQTVMRFFAHISFDDRSNQVVAPAMKCDSSHIVEYRALMLARCGKVGRLKGLLSGAKLHLLTETTLCISEIAFILHRDADGEALCCKKRAELQSAENTQSATAGDSENEDSKQFHEFIQREWKALSDLSKRFDRQKACLPLNAMPHEKQCFLTGIQSEDAWRSVQHDDLRLEIGGGSGDWMIAQMKVESEAHWVALDIRTDRLWQNWVKLHFNGLPPQRATFIGGDARSSLKSCPDSFFASIFVNFPEPPTFYDDPDRLYNADMLRALCRVLKTGGALYFLTDDCRLAVDVLKQVSEHQIEFTAQQTNGRLWSSKAPKTYASSFFDAFWKNGSQNARYFLTLVKDSHGGVC